MRPRERASPCSVQTACVGRHITRKAQLGDRQFAVSATRSRVRRSNPSSAAAQIGSSSLAERLLRAEVDEFAEPSSLRRPPLGLIASNNCRLSASTGSVV